jgi:hypothetical protein
MQSAHLSLVHSQDKAVDQSQHQGMPGSSVTLEQESISSATIKQIRALLAEHGMQVEGDVVAPGNGEGQPGGELATANEAPQMVAQAQGGHHGAQPVPISPQQLSQFIANIPNPVRDIAKDLRKEMTDFVEAALVQKPSTLGFLGQEGSSLSATHMVETLNAASAKLEAIFNNDADRTGLGVTLRSFAQKLQTGVDSFRSMLIRGQFGDRIPATGVEQLVRGCLEMKGYFAGTLQEMDGFMFQQVMAALGQS